MTAQHFYRNKMRWLNELCRDCAVSPMEFRIAYLIADHLNSVSGDAWPSHRRIASGLCVTTKTVQRAAKELESKGWLQVRRSKRKRTNRYRLRWPGKADAQEDNLGLNSGQFSPPIEDTDVRQSFLDNPPRTFSTGHRGRKPYFPDRGLYEQQITERFGPETQDLLQMLHENAPDILNSICRAQKFGTLTAEHLVAARSHLFSLHHPGRRNTQ